MTEPKPERRDRTRAPAALLALIALAILAVLACGAAGDAKAPQGEASAATPANAANAADDPLAAEIERWSAVLKAAPDSGIWGQIKPGSQQALARADEHLRAGRRLLALQQLAGVRASLAAGSYLSERPAEQKQAAGFEAEWARMGTVLRADLKPSAAALQDVRPAAVRALGEWALSQVRGFYEASLEYGRSTMPEDGLFYLGSAQGQQELAAFMRKLSEPSSRRLPPVRALGPELDALEAELLAAYRPPASIDRHGEFIVASSMVKEARELDAAGLRYGALFRYLRAAQQIAPLRTAPPPETEALAARLRAMEERLGAGDVDHSLGRLFLESAQADLAATAPGASPATAAAIVDDVLPRYFAALEPGRSQEPKPAPRATVTLVRWPYT